MDKLYLGNRLKSFKILCGRILQDTLLIKSMGFPVRCRFTCPFLTSLMQQHRPYHSFSRLSTDHLPEREFRKPRRRRSQLSSLTLCQKASQASSIEIHFGGEVPKGGNVKEYIVHKKSLCNFPCKFSLYID